MHVHPLLDHLPAFHPPPPFLYRSPKMNTFSSILVILFALVCKAEAVTRTGLATVSFLSLIAFAETRNFDGANTVLPFYLSFTCSFVSVPKCSCVFFHFYTAGLLWSFPHEWYWTEHVRIQTLKSRQKMANFLRCHEWRRLETCRWLETHLRQVHQSSWHLWPDYSWLPHQRRHCQDCRPMPRKVLQDGTCWFLYHCPQSHHWLRLGHEEDPLGVRRLQFRQAYRQTSQKFAPNFHPSLIIFQYFNTSQKYCTINFSWFFLLVFDFFISSPWPTRYYFSTTNQPTTVLFFLHSGLYLSSCFSLTSNKFFCPEQLILFLNQSIFCSPFFLMYLCYCCCTFCSYSFTYWVAAWITLNNPSWL